MLFVHTIELFFCTGYKGKGFSLLVKGKFVSILFPFLSRLKKKQT